MFHVARWKWDAFFYNLNGRDIFSLEDLVSANWIWKGEAQFAEITNLTKQGKGKHSLLKIMPKFFKALLKVTMEAQYRKTQGFRPDDGIDADETFEGDDAASEHSDASHDVDGFDHPPVAKVKSKPKTKAAPKP